MKKNVKDNIITYGLVLVFFAVVQTMLSTGKLSSLFKGLLIPAVSSAALWIF